MGMFDFLADRGGYTYEDVQRRRALVDALAQTGSPQTFGEGLSSVGGAIGAILGGRRADAAEEKRAAMADGVFEAALGSVPQDHTALASALAPQTASFQPTGDTLRDGIVQTAQAIGADPLDLATAISYETAGTFDPMKAGPTTQWGQHRGLIQFGEPQAKQHGVDFSSPDAALASQLGPDGAIAGYFRGAGFRPGMSGLDLYSTINAGAPGRYSASDANNGGAPGSVADKWNNQMQDHRAKAAALLGGDVATGSAPVAPAFTAQPAPVNVSLIRAMSNPYLSPEQKQILAGVMAQQQAQQITPFQQAQLQMEQERHALDMAQANQPAPVEGVNVGGSLINPITGEVMYQAPAEPPTPTDDIREYQFAVEQGYEGTFQDFMNDGRRAGATSITVGGEGMPGLGKLSTDYGYVYDPQTGQPVIDPVTGLPESAPIPGSPAALELQEAQDKRDTRETQAGNAATVVLQDIDKAIGQVSGWTAGVGSKLAAIPGTDARDLQASLDTVRANIGFDRLQQMREASPTGGALGGIAIQELQMLQAVMGSLDAAQSPGQLRANLQRLKEIYEPIARKAAAYPNAAEFGFVGGPDAPPGEPSDDDLINLYGG